MNVYTVRQVTTYLKELLESDVHLADLWVTGEVSNLSRSANGHLYFTLKDSGTQIRCVYFRRARMPGADLLAHGAQVVAHGRVSLYEVRGDLQYYVDFVHAQGVGLLHLQFERLKAQLEEEGLFDEARKRPIPPFPRRIGVVTSPYGAVFHDICHVLARRWPLVEVVLAPTQVQGEGAVAGIVAALVRLNDLPDLDLIIVARGGGSLEDLWPFNEEAVARAVYGSRVPVISAIGHETDVTICDYVADVRAPTPSAAAERAVPDRAEFRLRLRDRAVALRTCAERAVEERAGTVDRAVALLDRCLPDLEVMRTRVEELATAAAERLERGLHRQRERVEARALQLHALDPRQTLARGYAVVQDRESGRIISRRADAAPGRRLGITVSDGPFDARVEEAP
ncbi:MAG TPA: exodeoxyribonuclease VII large subunit [Dehalococcoidia bacterium]